MQSEREREREREHDTDVRIGAQEEAGTENRDISVARESERESAVWEF